MCWCPDKVCLGRVGKLSLSWVTRHDCVRNKEPPIPQPPCDARRFLSFQLHLTREVDMSDEYATPESRITAALAHARKARHHPDCCCRSFDRQFCNAADALWQRAVNRELETIIAWRQHASA